MEMLFSFSFLQCMREYAMIGPYRLKRSSAGAAPISGTTFQDYLDRLMKMIPAEVVGLYLLGNGAILAGQGTDLAFIICTVICIIAVVVVRIYGTTDSNAKNPVDWIHVAISSIAFLIWIYTLGGPSDPFVSFHLYQPWIGSILVLVWTFFVPIFYRGAD